MFDFTSPVKWGVNEYMSFGCFFSYAILHIWKQSGSIVNKIGEKGIRGFSGYLIDITVFAISYLWWLRLALGPPINTGGVVGVIIMYFSFFVPFGWGILEYIIKHDNMSPFQRIIYVLFFFSVLGIGGGPVETLIKAYLKPLIENLFYQ